MSFLDLHKVNLVVFLPLLFAALLAFWPKTEKSQIRSFTLVAMLIDLVFAVWMYLGYEPSGAEFQMEYRVRWLDEVGISFHTGVDGLAVSLMLLTAILGPLVVMGSWTYIQDRVKEFHIALLILQVAMLGALCSLDMVLFYIFWEAMLIPMYLLVGVWGSEERQKAAMKFFIYTLVGSLLMLVALLGVYFISQPAGARSFDYAAIFNGLTEANQQLSACVMGTTSNACDQLSPVAQALKTYGPWMFLAFALAFAIKVPMFPVHTWLPDAHVQAPAAGSMILAGVMLKMGTFGFWRFAIPFFPQAARDYRGLLSTLAVIGIVYGALMCLAQKDIKKLIAYSSVSHLGYCMLGMVAFTPEGATGSAYQMLNHGVSTGALFLLFGMLYERRHARLMSDYGGIAKVVPVFTVLFLVITFSSIAVPGTNGFIGEFLVLLGTFQSSLSLWMGVFAATGVILGAAYMLWMVQKVFFGKVTHTENEHLQDVNGRELATAIPFVAMVLVMGLMPQPFLDRLEPSTQRFIARASVGLPEAKLDNVKVEVQALSPQDGAEPSRAPSAAPPRVQAVVPAPQPLPLRPLPIMKPQPFRPNAVEARP